MMRRRWLVLLACLVSQVGAAAHAADLMVLTAGAFKPVLLALQPEFERATGHRLQIRNGTGGELSRMVTGGAAFDVLVAPQEVLQTLSAALVPDVGGPVARVGIGVMVRRDTAVPDVSTVAALRTALLAAPSIAMIDPASGGSSGPAVLALFARLGIADEVRGRLVLKQGGLVADLVADGHAALGLHQISEILPVQGVVLAGALPEAVQTYTTYTAAIGRHAASGTEAAALFTALHGPVVAAALRARGMEPAAQP